jgi:hypothetical protein
MTYLSFEIFKNLKTFLMDPEIGFQTKLRAAANVIDPFISH